MPRRPRPRLAGIPFHVIQRGNNRGDCFHDRGDYARYLAELAALSRRHDVAIHCYVLMTNHVHLLLTPGHPDALPLMMKALGQRYAQYGNRKRQRTGSFWDGRYRSCLVDTDGYLLTCHRYIEYNPVRAGMVGDPGEYRWSSYRSNALGQPDVLLTRHALVEGLGSDRASRLAAYSGLFSTPLDPADIHRIRTSINAGLALGGPRFEKTVADALGRRVTPGQRGRPKKKMGSDPI